MKTVLLATAMFACNVITVKSQTLSIAANDTCNLQTITATFTGGVVKRLGWMKDDSIVQMNSYWNSYGERIDKESGNYTPSGIATDKDGNLYVVEQNNNRVLKYAPGESTGVVVAGGNGFGDAANQLAAPVRIAVDNNNNLFIADALNSRIQKWAPGVTEGITVAGGNGYGDDANQLRYPVAVAIAANGDFFVSDYEAHCIKKYTEGSVEGTVIAGGHGTGKASNQLYFPYGICLDNAGNLYIADSYNNRIQKWLAGAENGITIAGGDAAGNNYDQLSYPIDVEVATNGDIFILDNANSRVQCKKRERVFVTIVGGLGETTDKLQRPQDICFAWNDSAKLYVANWYNTSGGVIEYVKTKTISTTFNPVVPGLYKAFAISEKGKLFYSNNSIFLNIKPSPGTPIQGNRYYSVNEIQSYFGDSSSGLNNYYEWGASADAVVVSGQGTPEARIKFGNSLSAIIYLTIKNSCGSSETSRKRVELEDGLALKTSSANAMNLHVTARLLPNPASDKAIINFTAAKSEPYQLSITNSAGKVVYQLKDVSVAGSNTKTVLLSGFAGGVYFVTLNMAKETLKYKLVVQK